MTKRYLFLLLFSWFSLSLMSSSDSSSDDELDIPNALRYFIIFADDSENFDDIDLVAKFTAKFLYSKNYPLSLEQFSLAEQISWTVQEIGNLSISAIERAQDKNTAPFRSLCGDASFSRNYFPLQLMLPEQATENIPDFFQNLSISNEFKAPALFMLLRSSAKIKSPRCEGINRQDWLGREVLNPRYNPFIDPRNNSYNQFEIIKTAAVDLNAYYLAE